MSRTRTIAIVAALLVVAAGGVPTTTAAAESLTIDVDQGRQGSVYVTVTSNGTAVEGADVDVSTVDENATYEGEDEDYETDANGSVVLPVPEEDITVDVRATDANRTANTTATLYAPDLDVSVTPASDGSATATVIYAITDEPAEGATVNVSTADVNDTYVGEGQHVADENGTIDLPAPNDTVAIHLHASVHDLEGSTQTILQNASEAEETYKSFGARVSAFVQSVLADNEGGIGRIVADFVTSNNPGNAPDHAGPPTDVGPSSSTGAQGGNSTAIQGGPDNGGGPPDHAGKGDGHPGNGKAKNR